MAYNLKFPPRCIRCGKRLQPTPKGPDFLPCKTCPSGTRVIYYLQLPSEGYPGGWPLCVWCGSPTVDGKAPAPSDLDQLSPEARVALLAGLESARTRPPVYRGSFAQYANDDDDE